MANEPGNPQIKVDVWKLEEAAAEEDKKRADEATSSTMEEAVVGEGRMANNPGHSQFIETVEDVRMLEVVAEPDKKSSDAATTSAVEEADEDPGKTVVREIPSLLMEVKGYRQRNVDEIQSYCAKQWKSRNVVLGHEGSGFYKVPQHMPQRQARDHLYNPTYINFSKIRDMLENDDPDVQTRSLLNHCYYHFLGIHNLNPEVKLEDYLLMIYEDREKIARCYGVTEADLDFPQLLGLLLSSCFVICLLYFPFHNGFIAIPKDFHRWFKDIWRTLKILIVAIQEDRECYHRWVNDIWVDLLVLENQIPFFILKRVLGKVKGGDDSTEFHTHYYFQQFVPLNRYDKRLNGFHLLDIVHRSLLPDKQSDHRSYSFFTNWPYFCYRFRAFLWGERVFYSTEPPVMRVIPTATRLQQAGVKFRPVERKGFVVDFKKGVLRLPSLHIRKNTEKFFMNLIAWEQCHQPAVKYVINFAILMDHLINTSKDVQILIQKNVLELCQVTEEEVAAMFNRLGEDLIYTQNERRNGEYDFLTELSIELNNYCKSRFNKWWADLMKVYFRSPWTIFSLLVALLIILLTLVQAIFSPLSYFRRP